MTPTLEEHLHAGICPSCRALASRAERSDAFRPPAGWLPLIYSSIQEVFGMMLGCETGPSVAETPSANASITAIVGLAGKLRGMVSIRCTSRAACGMAGAMLGSNVTEDADDEVKDALGEVCNMVAGNFKAKLPGMADGCSLSTPTVITGADYHVRPMSFGEQVVLTCSFHGEPVWVTLDLHR